MCAAGVFWPTESLDEWLKIVSRVTPITYPVEAIRDILLKGDLLLTHVAPSTIIITMIAMLITCSGT